MLSSSSSRETKDEEVKVSDSFTPKMLPFPSKALIRLQENLNHYDIVAPTLIREKLYRITPPKHKLMPPLYCDLDKDEMIFPQYIYPDLKVDVEESGTKQAMVIYKNFYAEGKHKKIPFTEFEKNERILADKHELRFFIAFDDYKEFVKRDLHALFRQGDNYITRISIVNGASHADDLHITAYEINNKYHSHTFRFRIGDGKTLKPAYDKAWDSYPETELSSQDLKAVVFPDLCHIAILSRATGNFHITSCAEFSEFPVFMPEAAKATMPQFAVLGLKTILCSALSENEEAIFPIEIDIKEKKFTASEKPLLTFPQGSIAALYGLSENIVLLTKHDDKNEILQCYEYSAEKKELKSIEHLNGISNRKIRVKLDSGEMIFWDCKTKFISIINPYAKELIKIEQIENVEYLFKYADHEVVLITKDKRAFKCVLPDYALQAKMKQVEAPKPTVWTAGFVKFHRFAERKDLPKITPSSITINRP